ncbi:hypothetical protein PG987_010423 [Apiospora arundinis]
MLDTEIVKSLLRETEDVNKVIDTSLLYWKGQPYATALFAAVAAYHGQEWQLDLVELLLDHGADPCMKDYSGQTVMHIAATMKRQNLPELLEILLTHLSDINARDNEGRTPLSAMISAEVENRLCFKNSVSYVGLFVDRGANPSIPDFSGYSPVHIAAYQERDGRVAELLDLGADPDPKTAIGHTPLHLSCMSFITYLKDREYYKHLPDCYQRLSDGPPFWAPHVSRHYRVSELLTMSAICTKPSLDASAELSESSKSDFGINDLYLDRSSTRLVFHSTNALSPTRMRIEEGVVDDDGYEADKEWWIDSTGRAEVVQLLIDAGAQVDGQDEEGCTPLHYAALAGDLFLVEVLIRDHHANHAATNAQGQTPLHLACSGFDYEDRWLCPGDREHIVALRRGIIGLLIDCGIDTMARDNDGRTAMEYALSHPADYLLLFLAERLSDRNHGLIGENSDDMTPDLSDYFASEQQVKHDVMWQPSAHKSPNDDESERD